MSYTVKKVTVWAADVRNRAGTLACILEALTNVGAQLEFMIARRVNDNTSRVFLAPIKGRREQRTAREVGLVQAANMHSLRIEGPDRPGLGALIMRCVAGKGINLRGASAAALGRKAIFYLALENESNLKEATSAVRKLLAAKRRR